MLTSIALTNDGRVPLSHHYVEGADISDRKRWEGIVLSVPEAAKVFGAMSDEAGRIPPTRSRLAIPRSRSGPVTFPGS
jgi:hypothetical protein